MNETARTCLALAAVTLGILAGALGAWKMVGPSVTAGTVALALALVVGFSEEKP